MKTSKIKVITSISNPDLLTNITEKKILLAGESMFASLNSTTPPGLISQPPRDAMAGLLSQFNKNTPKVFVAINQQIFDIPKIRVALAIDGYLAWGLRQKVPTILFGGGESETGVNVEIMIFSKNQLIELREKVLPQTESIYFRDSLTAMLTELKLTYPTARFVQAAPLTNWALPEVEYIDDKPLRGLSYRPISRTPNHRSNYLMPVALTAIGMLIYPAMAITGWTAYSTAVADYETAIADPAIKSKDGMDTDYLTTMNSRRMYMNQPRRQTALADKSSSIVAGIAAIPDVQIMEMKLPAPGINPQEQIGLIVNPESKTQRIQITNTRPADMWISIATPKAGDVAIMQAQEIMTKIANTTGMSLRLTHQGWRDDGKRRIFNIEGFVHD